MRLWAYTALPFLLALPLAPRRPLAFITEFLATGEPVATMVEEADTMVEDADSRWFRESVGVGDEVERRGHRVYFAESEVERKRWEDADSKWFRESFGEGVEAEGRGHRVYFAEGEMGGGGEVQEGVHVGSVERHDVVEEDEPVPVEEVRLESVESEFRLLLVRLPALVEAAVADIARDLAGRSMEGFAIALGYLLSGALESAADYLLEDEASHWFTAFLMLSSLTDAWPYLFPGVFGAGPAPRPAAAALTCSSGAVYGAVARSGLAGAPAARAEGELAVIAWQLRRDLHLGLACVLDR